MPVQRGSYVLLFGAVIALVGSSCWAPEPSVQLTVLDPDNRAAHASQLAAGTSSDALATTDMTGHGFPLTLTVVSTSPEVGDRDIWVEARGAGGVVLARGITHAVFRRRDPNKAQVILTGACDSGVPNGARCTAESDDPNGGICINSACTVSRCGDGFADVTTGEECDDGNTDNNDGCLRVRVGDHYECRLAKCGDGHLQTGAEDCDDGNNVSGDGCSADCKKIEICGDGILDAGELCDDGNDNPNDSCFVAPRELDDLGCGPTTWLSRLVLGLGASAGNPVKASLSHPSGVAIDLDHNVIIADSWNNRVYRLEAATGLLLLIAGDGAGGFGGDGGPATVAHLENPLGVAVDGSGNVYVADERNNRIRVVDRKTGIITTVVGNGVRGFGGDGGAATLATLNQPAAVVIDGMGDIYIADRLNSRVRRVDAQTRVITTVAGGGSKYSLFVEGAGATEVPLMWPTGLALDSAGHLYIADQISGFIRVVDLETGLISTAAGGAQGTDRFLNLPAGVALDGHGNLLIADTENNRVRNVDLATGVVTTAIGGGAPVGTGDGGLASQARLAGPWALAVDDNGRIVVADTGEHLVRVVDPTTHVITTLAGDGLGGFGGDQAAATAAALTKPWGLSVDGQGRVLISDSGNQRVRVLDRNLNALTTVAGNGGTGFHGEDGGLATQATLTLPSSAVADANGNIYVADQWNNRIRRVDAATHVITTVAGAGASGLGDGGDAFMAQLEWPNTLVLDGNELIFTDAGHERVRAIDLAASPPVITTIAGSGAFGYTDGPAASATFAEPSGLALAPDGSLYVADTYNHVIRRISPDRQQVATFAGTGVQGFAGDGGQAALAQLDTPYGVAIDALTGEVLIADTLNHRLRAVSGAGVIRTIAGTGTQGSRGDGGAAGTAQLNAPHAVAVDALGNVLVADASNDRIRLIEVASGRITTIAGAVDAAGDGSFAGAKLSGPNAIAFLPTNTIAVADGAAGRVRLVDETAKWLSSVVGYGDYRSDTFAPGNLAHFSRLLAYPSGIVYVDSLHSLLVAERDGNVIRRVEIVDPATPSTWTVSTFAGGLARSACCQGDGSALCSPTELADPGCVDDSADYRGDGGFLAEVRLWEPTALAYDRSDPTLGEVVYVADTQNQVIRRIAIATQTIDLIAGVPGHRGYYGENVDPKTALFESPQALAVGPNANRKNGSLYVGDTGNNRVRRIDLDTQRIVTVIGDGSPNSSGNGEPAQAFPVDGPLGLTVDRYGNLFISSRTTIREVFAGSDGVATGESFVVNVYGEAPRLTFPSSATNCLSGITFDPRDPDQGVFYVVDACQGFLLRFVRSTDEGEEL